MSLIHTISDTAGLAIIASVAFSITAVIAQIFVDGIVIDGIYVLVILSAMERK